MSELSEIERINKIALNYLQFDDIKKLDVEQLSLIRITVLDKLTEVEHLINLIRKNKGDWSSHATIKAHYKRVVGMINGIVASKNRGENKAKEKKNEKLRVANARITELEKEIKNLRLLVGSGG